MIMTGSNIV